MNDVKSIFWIMTVFLRVLLLDPKTKVTLDSFTKCFSEHDIDHGVDMFCRDPGSLNPDINPVGHSLLYALGRYVQLEYT